MKPDKQKALNEAYNRFMKLMLEDLPLDSINDLAVENVTGFGSTVDEKILDINRLRQLVIDQREQGAGVEMSVDMKPVHRRVSPEEDTALFIDEFEITIQADDEKNVLNLRLSTIFEFMEERWKVVHMHGSTGVATEGDTWHMDEWKKKMEELQKLVDEKTADLLIKNRELEIESALERVRARTMAMHKSDALKDVVRVLYKEFRILVTDIHSVNIQLNPDSSKDIHFWASVEEDIYPELYHVPYVNLPIFEKFYNAFNSPGDGFLDYLLYKEEKDAFFSEVFKIQPVPPQRKKMIQNAKGMVMMGWFHKHSGIDILRYNLERFSEEEKDIVKRFAAAFEQTYIRFLDLQKAEAQAREAEIQLALERVRARTMAMHQSSELSETGNLLLHQIKQLGIDAETSWFWFIDLDTDMIEIWTTHENKLAESIKVKASDYTTFKRELEAWKNNEPFVKLTIPKQEATKVIMDIFGIKLSDKEEATHFHLLQTRHKYGFIGIGTWREATEEEMKICARFASVFEQTYTRFLDLEKAEAQVREAEIQLALERVRARTMAMHLSDELAETAAILFQQMTELGVSPERINICLIKEADNILEVWATDQQGIKISHHFNASLDEPTTGKRVYDAWKEKKKSVIIDLSGKELNDWIRYVREEMGMTIKDELIKEHRIHSVAFFSQGMILTTTPEPLPKESIKLLERFADVFNLTYRRFLDLQKAEAQARESEIQLALERVRARTMAMQKSEELAEVAGIVFEQLTKLGVQHLASGVTIIDKNKPSGRMWMSYQGDMHPEPFTIDFNSNPVLSRVYKSWKDGESFFINQTSGQEFIQHIQFLKKVFGERVEQYIETTKKQFKDAGKEMPEQMVMHHTFFPSGSLILNNIEPVKEQEILNRFAGVFDQTYTRFLDLQKAEAQNKIISAENERKTKELEDARELQFAMLPKEIPEHPGLDIKVYMQTATEVGGDYYDFSVRDDESINIAIGDATGHGMKAGTLVTMMKSLFTANSENKDIEGFFKSSNDAIKNSNLKRMMIGFAMLNIKDHKAIFINAAMPPVYHYIKTEKKIEEIKQHNLPLGAMKIEKYNSADVTLNTGDVLLMMSDGFPELHNPDDKLFGYEKVYSSFKKVAEKPPEEIIKYLNEEGLRWREGKELQDDVTFVVVKIK